MAHNYITQTGATSGDLTAHIGNSLVAQLWSDESGAVSQTAIDASITAAESIIDGMLVGEYTVPMTLADGSPPEVIRTIAKDIATYYGYSRKPEFMRADGNNPWGQPYKTAMDLLKKVRSGELRLEEETAEQPADIGGEVYCSTNHFITEPYEGTSGPSGGF